MKPLLMFSLVSALMAATTMPVIALASDGVVNFTGTVTATTCRYAGTAGSSQTVTLPTVSTSALNAAGITAGTQPFDINLTGCGRTAQRVAVNLDGGSYDGSTGRLINTAATAPATNVSLQLANRNSGTNIQVPSASMAVSSSPGGDATIPLTVQYFAEGVATAGAVASSVSFSIVYP
jgi:major type 1 subunit fimbrin (pilin)